MYSIIIIVGYIYISIFMKKRALFIKQIDNQLRCTQPLRRLSVPQQGWIKTIRKALGMTAQQMATKLGVSRSRIIKIEQDELRQVLTLKTLYGIANVLNCDLI